MFEVDNTYQYINYEKKQSNKKNVIKKKHAF